MTMQSPEILLPSLNSALRRLRGACTVLGNDEIDKSLLEVMRRLILAEVLGDKWIIAMGGSQGAGKTTLMSTIYELNDWLKGNEGRGEKMPVLIYESDDTETPQGYVRRLVPVKSPNKDAIEPEIENKIGKTKPTDFTLDDVPVKDIAEFQKIICDPAPADLLPVLKVPPRFFNQKKQAWLLLPGYEKQERSNRSWQELMRQAMIAAGGCIVVTDETRMANVQQIEIVKDMLENELKNCQPYIVISKTESCRNTENHPKNEQRRREIITSACATFKVDDKHVILSGAEDPQYIKEWLPQLRTAINDLTLSGTSNRQEQMAHLTDVIGKDLTRVLNTIRSKSRIYFASTAGDADDSLSVAMEKILEEFDIAAESLREKHTREVNANADKAFEDARRSMLNLLKNEHEGFKNIISNVFQSTSEDTEKMNALVQRSWQTAAPGFHSNYSISLGNLTAPLLGRTTEEESRKPSQGLLAKSNSEKLIELGYKDKSGKSIEYKKLKKDTIKDLRILLGNTSEEEEKAYQDTSKKLGASVALLPALTLEYSRIAYAMPKSWGLTGDGTLGHPISGGNVTRDGVASLSAGVDLGRTAIKAFAALLAVDVVSDGDADILNVFTNNTPTSNTPTGTPPPLPTGTPLTLHPAAVAVAAVVAGAYVTSIAITGVRNIERQASARAHSMLANVRDQQAKHLRESFDHAIAVARDRVKEKLRERYHLDETLMQKDRLAVAIADVSAIANDLRHELESSPVGLQPFLIVGED